MNAIIKQIVIFNNTGGKRAVPFSRGLNIITGDSKTGKSALIEIVDYCLFSSRSGIPKGKITEFASLFVVIFQINDNFVVVGRPAPDKGNIREAYFNIEFDYSKLEDIKYSYFDNLIIKPIKDDVQTEFEEYLGLSIKQLDTESEEKSLGKLSVRDTVSFLFQHQNLIANKHALFYRFDDFNKRKRVIEAFPVLFGAADQDYFDLSRQKQNLERQIKAEQKILDRIKLDRNEAQQRLEGLVQLYFSKLGKTLEPGLSFGALRNVGSNLPSPPEVIGDQTKLYTDIANFEKERELKYIEKAEVEKALSSFYSTDSESFDYVKELVKVHAIQDDSETDLQNLKCPICENSVNEVSENIKAIKESRHKLVDELKKVGSYAKDHTETTSKLRKKKRELDGEIARLTKSLTELTREDKNLQDKKNKREELFYYKGIIHATIEAFLENLNLKGENKHLKNLEEELNTVNDKLKKYNLDKFYLDSSIELKSNMDRIANKLDFEDELKPIDFHFDLKTFNFYHSKTLHIRLEEMGSGANWLACHLSLFLSFLNLTSSNKKSVIPSFLMLDQPSQVYFPRTAKLSELQAEEKNQYDDNIEQVKKIFRVLNEEIELIDKNHGFKPQIIVLEHANDSEFRKFIAEEWDKSKGQGLI